VFVTKVKEKSGLTELLKNWETKLGEGVFVSGEKISVLVPYFKETSFKEITFRYLTISRQDLGICYLILDDYFILATSFEGMKKVIEEVEDLSLIKKSGQLFIVGFEGKTLTPQLEDLLKKYRPGGVLLLSKNIGGKEQLKSLIGGLQSLSLEETGLPLFIAVDQEGEPLSRIEFLQEKTGQSEIENKEQAYQIGLKRGEELKELGVNLKLAPILDFTNEGDFLFNRSFQKSPSETGNLAKSLVLGQKETGIFTAIKHFPGYSEVSFNPEEKLATIKKTPEISQFKKAMEANPEMVMVSNAVYQEINHLPFVFSPQAIQFLKNNLGSEILIVSDDLSQNSLLENFTLKEIVTKPFQAGIDVLIFSGWRSPVTEALEVFSEAVENGAISEEIINEAVSKIIQLKQKLGE
jgi:beta-N-acetylhexosaminidase